jgi:hypothetical protein
MTDMGVAASDSGLPDGKTVPMRVRSMVGLIPLFAVETLEPALLEKVPVFKSHMEWFS